LAAVVYDVFVAVVDDFEGVLGAVYDCGGGRPDVGTGVLDACCLEVSQIALWGELGERARTSNGRDGVQVGRISLSKNQGHGICGTGGWGPGNVEGCSDRNGLRERIDREWILGRCQGRESREKES